jgi:hypothetical protein
MIIRGEKTQDALHANQKTSLEKMGHWRHASKSSSFSYSFSCFAFLVQYVQASRKLAEMSAAAPSSGSYRHVTLEETRKYIRQHTAGPMAK